jgi:hypothetical protein
MFLTCLFQQVEQKKHQNKPRKKSMSKASYNVTYNTNKKTPMCRFPRACMYVPPAQPVHGASVSRTRGVYIYIANLDSACSFAVFPGAKQRGPFMWSPPLAAGALREWEFSPAV